MSKVCETANCEAPVFSKGLCKKCYKRLWMERHRDKTLGPDRKRNRSKLCAAEGCDQTTRTAGYCYHHYWHLVRKPELAAIRDGAKVQKEQSFKNGMEPVPPPFSWWD